MNKWFTLSIFFMAGLLFCNTVSACPAGKSSKGTHGTETEETGK